MNQARLVWCKLSGRGSLKLSQYLIMFHLVSALLTNFWLNWNSQNKNTQSSHYTLCLSPEREDTGSSRSFLGAERVEGRLRMQRISCLTRALVEAVGLYLKSSIMTTVQPIFMMCFRLCLRHFAIVCTFSHLHHLNS